MVKVIRPGAGPSYDTQGVARKLSACSLAYSLSSSIVAC